METGGLMGIVETFGVRGDLLAAQLINFLIVLLVLWRFAYRPILKMLDDRERKIAESLTNANEINQKLRTAEEEKRRILQEARSDAEQQSKDIIESTKKRCDDMVTAAKTQVEELVAKGKQTLDNERASMMTKMRQDIIDISVAAASRIVSEGVSEKKSQSLAEEVVRKMT
jgi:F-type H+-transporting ATPase subunit b